MSFGKRDEVSLGIRDDILHKKEEKTMSEKLTVVTGANGYPGYAPMSAEDSLRDTVNWLKTKKAEKK